MSTPVLSLSPPLQSPAVSRRPAAIAAATRHITSQSLLAGGRELVIQHQGGEYHLRLTRNDKLILTK
ncbi:MAG: hemin uptake protein HemP [Rhodanobacter sp.]